AQVFCEVFSPPARLLIVGAVQIAMPLVELARVVGFQTYVIDPRQVFANRERFPTADEIVVGWPADELEALTVDESTFIVFISHDEKFDLPALLTALKSKARYIGALGSRTTHAARVEKLMRLGLQPEEIARIHAPIGLDIGAAGSQEIALAILAQMIAVKNGKNLPGKSAGSA
ncbi:MAG: XdhC family protein, partial [Anaerolineaceae bacterium]